MNRRALWVGLMLFSLVWIAGLGGCDGCSGSNSGSDNVAATSGSGQITQVLTTFANQLSVTVTTSGGTPVSGAVVTFTAPAQTVASATFAGGANTATTNASGVATSAVVSANGIAGGPYTVTATVPNGAGPASFTLTNTPGPAAGISCTSGTPQTAAVNAPFTNPLGVQVVDGENNPVSDAGVVVTFTAPDQTLASATFAGGVNTATTNASGLATSVAVSANGIVGGPYNVTASASIGDATPTCNFSLTNSATVVTTANYTFYLSGLETINEITAVPNFYGLVGAVSINTANGAVVLGEEDYNDGAGFTFPAVSITGGQLSINSTGQGTLSLITNQASLGASGTETLAVQFVNNDHALIMQFDGSATSSGSMDLQTLPNPLAPPSGAFSFAFSGVDQDYDPIAAGGVFSISGTALSGTFDVNDFGAVTTGVPFPLASTISTPDAFGRGAITNTSLAVTLNYYVVGAEAIRIIDMDSTAADNPPFYDSGVGSAFGQGTATTFSNASLGPAVFGVGSNSFGFGFNFDGILYDAAGQLTTSNTGSSPANFSGVADDNELGEFVSGAPISGTYSICGNSGCGGNGYGSLAIASDGQCTEALGDVCFLGVYMVDPSLNINDPNNTTSGLGGAVIADLDEFLVGTGVLIPQTDTSTGSFTGNYAFGGQDFNESPEPVSNGWEFDFIGQGNFTTFFSDAPGLISDPFFFFDTTSTISNATFSFTPQADGENPGRYIPSALTITPATAFENPLQLLTTTYQASGDILLWVNLNDSMDSFFSTFGGSIQQQTLPLTLPMPSVKAKPAAGMGTKLKP
jgi:hypothetical protein